MAVAAAAGMTASAAPPSGEPTGPLAVSINFSAGTGTFNVSGGTGDLSAQGYGIVQTSLSGGTAPFTTTAYGIAGDPSGKLGLTDNGRGADTIGYGGFSVNEVESGYLRYAVSDAAGRTASARYPAAGSITVKRTS